MFTWLIVILELCVLAGAFWFVYLRDPRPARIKSDAWGSYKDVNRHDEVILLLSNRLPNGLEPESNLESLPSNRKSNVVAFERRSTKKPA